MDESCLLNILKTKGEKDGKEKNENEKAGEKDGKEETDKMIAREVSKLRMTARSARTAKKNVKLVVKGDLKAITDAGYTVKYKFYRYKAKVMVYDKDGNFVAQTALKQCKYASRLWTK